ncbi:AP-3 complex subunit beta [Coemansia javaensis]|uniref:AP-3 complex subunit beta n=1 Tax=Coemansia javaensis TaxID=2761396 RepID=A0A9W8LJX9_9FUNG|nr:AP-3 complex subunit beta [Coemansia javaensis]
MAEYLSRAVALAQDAARLSLRLSEGLVDNALEFGLDTPGSFYDNAEYRLWQARKELGSGSDKDKLAGMKRLLAAVARGVDASEYFVDVVKNVAAGSVEVRRLVYIYLLRYAEQEQDLALLSVNTFQRDLADGNQVIRAMALRVMSSIRVPAIGPIVVLAVRRLAADPSPHVRRAAALAVPKLLRLGDGADADAGVRAELGEVAMGMLGEASPLAVGAVIRAFRAACPGRLGAVHGHFRRWCAALPDVDEWGQVELVKLLAAYARTQFARPAAAAEPPRALDADHVLLLDAVRPLLHSRNSAVVMAAVAAHCHLAPAAQLPAVARPLVRLARAARETGFVALACALAVARRHPAALHAHARSFFVAAADPPFARRLKLQLLAAIAAEATAPAIAPEARRYARAAQPDVAAGAVPVLLACAQRARAWTMDCFRALLSLVAPPQPANSSSSSNNSSSIGTAGASGAAEPPPPPAVATAAMRAVRVLLLDGSVRDLHDRSLTLYEILCFLARALDTCAADGARAHIFALVGEFADSKFGALHALDVLRAGARSFGAEGDQAKMQLLELSARMRLAAAAAASSRSQQDSNGATLAALHAHLLTLARYDVSFEVRDRARALRALCPLPGDEAHADENPHLAPLAAELLGSAASAAALAGPEREAAAAAAPPPPAGSGRYTVGSLSLVMGRCVAGYEPLPDWPEKAPEPVDRGPLPGTGARAAAGPGAYGSQPVFIAGISGRPRPHAMDFSTPRSASAMGGADADNNDDDDLDAFLDSEDNSSNAAAAQRIATQYRPPQPLTATVFEQSALADSSPSEYSSSSAPLSSSSSELGSGDESESRASTTAGGDARPLGRSAEPSSGDDDDDDNEAAPLVSREQHHHHHHHHHHRQPLASSSGHVSSSSNNNNNNITGNNNAGHSSDDDHQLLLDDSSRHWQ